ncbi:MAG: 2-amino-4-hydroxy-6-hydroxymethyldihydropteridine diphosphokinase [Verrucomicrobia bacterium]|nr:2-amino-4-hydroxy-6-hydroxymethyldihydropteridine diphosphokinase [Verrucomicrobiota bacterium]
MPLTRAFVAFGSNVGERLETMRTALEMLTKDGQTHCVKTSPVYQNRAVGMGDAAPFLNAVVEFETALGADALLEICLNVEASLGRERGSAWKPRTIDLDVLLFGMEQRKEAYLTLPHPRIVERDFVAQPLLDIAPDVEIEGRSIKAIVAALPEFELELYAPQLVTQSAEP